MTALVENLPQAIYAAVVAVMRDLDPIEKNRTNAGQGFKFRGIEDVYAAVNPLLKKHSIFITAQVLHEEHEVRVSEKGKPQNWVIVRMQYTFRTVDGSAVSTEAVGEAIDQGDKAAAKAQTGAQKTALLQMFVVPTQDTTDPDRDSPDVGRQRGQRGDQQGRGDDRRGQRGNDQRQQRSQQQDEPAIPKSLLEAVNGATGKGIGAAGAAVADAFEKKAVTPPQFRRLMRDLLSKCQTQAGLETVFKHAEGLHARQVLSDEQFLRMSNEDLMPLWNKLPPKTDAKPAMPPAA